MTFLQQYSPDWPLVLVEKYTAGILCHVPVVTKEFSNFDCLCFWFWFNNISQTDACVLLKDISCQQFQTSRRFNLQAQRTLKSKDHS